MSGNTVAPAAESGIDRSPETFVRLAQAEVAAGYRLAGLFLRDASEAEDATQEALLRAWRAWPRFREDDRFSAWFDRILVNVCKNRLRKRSQVRWLPLQAEMAGEPASADPFVAALAKDELGRLVGRLSSDQQIVIALRFWGDQSLQEIADRLGVPVGTVKSRLHNAVAVLRKQLEEQSKERVR